MTEEKSNELIQTKNILPEDHKYLTFLKKVFRHEFRKNGFRRISTPFFEEDIFWEKIFGENYKQNIVNFDIKNKNIGLNPLASIFNLKAYIEEERKEELQPVYSYYMDRYYPLEKYGIQGKSLFGGDIIGENDIIIDVQNLFIIFNILEKIGLGDDYEIIYNFVGTKKEQEKYKEKLSDFLEDKKQILSDFALEKLEKGNILEIFKSENEDDLILLQNAPKIEKSYKKESKKDIIKLNDYLEILGLDAKKDDFLFGDYEFNDGLIWEIIEKDTKKVLAKGYGYNELSNSFEDIKEIPGSGFWVDVFKIIKKLKLKELKIKNKDKLDLFFVQLGDDAKKVVLPLTIQARQAGIKTAVSLGTPSIKEQMLKASRSKATFVVMVGLMEAKNGIFQLRDLATGKQQEIKKEELIDYLIEHIGKENLDFFDPSRDLLE